MRPIVRMQTGGCDRETHVKTKVIALAVAMAALGVDTAFAGFFQIIPNTPSVPEIDGSGSIAVVAIVMSLGAILFSKLKGGH